MAIMAQAEHQQRVVGLAAIAHQLPADEHRHLIPLDRAFERNVLQPLQPEVERGIPRAAELLRAGRAAQRVAIGLRHVDHRGGAADTAGIGERLDERLLPLGRPAIMPVFARHGRALGKIRPIAARDGGAVLHDAASCWGGGVQGRQDWGV